MDNIQNKLAIENKRLDEINKFLTDPKNTLINDFLEIIEEYGGPEEINKRARESGKLETILEKLKNGLNL